MSERLREIMPGVYVVVRDREAKRRLERMRRRILRGRKREEQG